MATTATALTIATKKVRTVSLAYQTFQDAQALAVMRTNLSSDGLFTATSKSLGNPIGDACASFTLKCSALGRSTVLSISKLRPGSYNHRAILVAVKPCVFNTLDGY